jgi:hypothetical protein
MGDRERIESDVVNTSQTVFDLVQFSSILDLNRVNGVLLIYYDRNDVMYDARGMFCGVVGDDV